MGRVFQQELASIQKIKIKKALLVLGGAKPEDNVMLGEAKSNPILASGLFAPFCLMVEGIDLGKQNIIMKDSLIELKKRTKKILHKITLPHDLAIQKNGKRIDLTIEEFPVNNEILDLGKETIALYEQKIKNAPAVLLKGLAGLCNTKEFSQGTERLLKATASSKGFTVISGGHTLTMIDKLKIPKSSFGYVSLSGGALIDYLAQGTLPGIEALK
jgi:phosphoglycerate kinase